MVSDLSEASFGRFLHQVANQKRKRGVDGVAELTRQQLNNASAALERHVQAALDVTANNPEVAGLEEEEGFYGTMQDAVLTLHGAALLALDLLTRSQQEPPEKLRSAAVLLHDGALMSPIDPDVDLGALQHEMQNAVMHLCCSWWERRAPGSHEVVARTIPYVLTLATGVLHERGRACLVHSCYMIRDALELLDYDDETIIDTKRMLLTCAMHPAFLRHHEGRRFIAGLFRLDPQLTNELAAIVRNQIPSNQRVALEAYGEIMFRAWRDTVGACAAEVEAELQALMQAAILASTPALATALRAVLNGLHSQRHMEKRLDAALVRLYDPILPRAFGAANAEVRRNAVNLLVAAFPIINPEAPALENNTRLTQQLGFLMEGLADVAPAVREAAVEGSCRCLNLYWEIIPAATSAKIISDISCKLAFDGVSRAVRVGVLRGLRLLVDNQNAQPVLKKVLPGVSALLHDSDGGVREALMELLVAVGDCRGLSVWNVVAPEVLLEAVASDTDVAVTRRIARILLPSYFPNAQEGSARVAALLRAKPEAGHVFCRHIVARFMPSSTCGRAANASGLPEFTASVPLEHIVLLAGALADHLLSTAPSLRSRDAEGLPPPPPAKRPKPAAGGRRGKGTAAGGPAAGKKRAKKNAAEPGDGGEEAGGDEQQEESAAGGAQAVAAAGEDDDVVVVQVETLEGWLAILGGLEVVAQGLGAAVVVAEEASGEELTEAFGPDSLASLLQAAEEQARKPEAVKMVLRIMASLHFLPAAQRAREVLFKRMAQGGIAGLGANIEPMEAGGQQAAQWNNPGLLSEALKTLAIGSNGPKLSALLSASLGVRESLPLHKPKKRAQNAGGNEHGGSGDGEGRDLLEGLLAGGAAAELLGLGACEHEDRHDEHDITCISCKRGEPEDSMLICDGCEAACHTHCLRPALLEVPETDWFCWRCESQLQAVQLPAGAAGRCVCLLLQHNEGRQLLFGHQDFSNMLQAMHQLAIDEADEVIRIAQAGADDEADSAPPLGAGGGAGATEAADPSSQMLGDPWGAMSRYCRAALHQAMCASMSGQAAQTGKDGEPPSVAPTPRRTPVSAGRGRGRHSGATASEQDTGSAWQRRQQLEQDGEGGGVEMAEGGSHSRTGFDTIVSVLEYSTHACNQLAQMVLELPSCSAAQLAALQFSQGLLRVLHVVNQAEILSMSPEYVVIVAQLCSSQAELVRAVAAVLAAQSDQAASQQQQACVAGTLYVILGLAQQMAKRVRRAATVDGAAPAGDGGMMPAAGLARRRGGAAGGLHQPAGSAHGFGGEDEEEAEEQLPSQQLEARMKAAAAGSGGGEELGLPSPRVSVENLAVGLVALLCDPAVGPLLKGAVRVGVADLVGELLAATRGVVTGGWLDVLCRLTGEALTAKPQSASKLAKLLTTCQRADSIGAGGDGDGGKANGDGEDAAEQLDGGGGTAVRGVVRRLKKGKAAVAEGAGPKAAGGMAAKLAELLQQESPAVATVAAVLTRVCAARKAHGRAMLLLASVATKSLARCSSGTAEATWRDRDDGQGTQQNEQLALPGASAVGATVLLSLCQGASPDAVGAAAEQHKPKQHPAGARRRPAGPYGALAQEAAAQAACAEAKEAARALGVLRRADAGGRALEPLSGQQLPSGGAHDNGGEWPATAAPEDAMGLARVLMRCVVTGGR